MLYDCRLLPWDHQLCKSPQPRLIRARSVQVVAFSAHCDQDDYGQGCEPLSSKLFSPHLRATATFPNLPTWTEVLQNEKGAMSARLWYTHKLSHLVQEDFLWKDILGQFLHSVPVPVTWSTPTCAESCGSCKHQTAWHLPHVCICSKPLWTHFVAKRWFLSCLASHFSSRLGPLPQVAFPALTRGGAAAPSFAVLRSRPAVPDALLSLSRKPWDRVWRPWEYPYLLSNHRPVILQWIILIVIPSTSPGRSAGLDSACWGPRSRGRRGAVQVCCCLLCSERHQTCSGSAQTLGI